MLSTFICERSIPKVVLIDVFTAVLKAFELSFCTSVQFPSIVRRNFWLTIWGITVVDELSEGGLEVEGFDINLEECEVMADVEIGKISDEVLSWEVKEDEFVLKNAFTEELALDLTEVVTAVTDLIVVVSMATVAVVVLIDNIGISVTDVLPANDATLIMSFAVVVVTVAFTVTFTWLGVIVAFTMANDVIVVFPIRVAFTISDVTIVTADVTIVTADVTFAVGNGITVVFLTSITLLLNTDDVAVGFTILTNDVNVELTTSLLKTVVDTTSNDLFEGFAIEVNVINIDAVSIINVVLTIELSEVTVVVGINTDVDVAFTETDALLVLLRVVNVVLLACDVTCESTDDIDFTSSLDEMGSVELLLAGGLIEGVIRNSIESVWIEDEWTDDNIDAIMEFTGDDLTNMESERCFSNDVFES